MARKEFHRSLISRTTAKQRGASTSKRVDGQSRSFKVYLDCATNGKSSFSIHAVNMHSAIFWATMKIQSNCGTVHSLGVATKYTDFPGSKFITIRGYTNDFEAIVVAKIYHLPKKHKVSPRSAL